MDIDHENMMYIPPEVEVCLFGLEDDLGQFLKHELVTRKISNFSPTEHLFNPRHGELMLHLADGLRPRAFLNCIDDPQILVDHMISSNGYIGVRRYWYVNVRMSAAVAPSVLTRISSVHTGSYAATGACTPFATIN